MAEYPPKKHLVGYQCQSGKVWSWFGTKIYSHQLSVGIEINFNSFHQQIDGFQLISIFSFFQISEHHPSIPKPHDGGCTSAARRTCTHAVLVPQYHLMSAKVRSRGIVTPAGYRIENDVQYRYDVNNSRILEFNAIASSRFDLDPILPIHPMGRTAVGPTVPPYSSDMILYVARL